MSDIHYRTARERVRAGCDDVRTHLKAEILLASLDGVQAGYRDVMYDDYENRLIDELEADHLLYTDARGYTRVNDAGAEWLLDYVRDRK